MNDRRNTAIEKIVVFYCVFSNIRAADLSTDSSNRLHNGSWYTCRNRHKKMRGTLVRIIGMQTTPRPAFFHDDHENIAMAIIPSSLVEVEQKHLL